MMEYSDIFSMIRKACQNNFINVSNKDIIVENATKIYIKQMELDFAREKLELEKENKNCQ